MCGGGRGERKWCWKVSLVHSVEGKCVLASPAPGVLPLCGMCQPHLRLSSISLCAPGPCLSFLMCSPGPGEEEQIHCDELNKTLLGLISCLTIRSSKLRILGGNSRKKTFWQTVSYSNPNVITHSYQKDKKGRGKLTLGKEKHLASFLEFINYIPGIDLGL